MLSMHNIDDREKMMQYYRTSDMLNLLYFFPDLSPITDLVVVDSVEEFCENENYLKSFDQNRVDTLKGRVVINGIENAGKNNAYYNTLLRVKEKDPIGVLVLFNVSNPTSERYERYAGISVGVNLGEFVFIDAVSKGFDGREVTKGICTHERYVIPWYDIRKVSIGNFKDYQTEKISDSDYQQTRKDRIEFLKSLGLNTEVFLQYIPEDYQEIPDFIWLDLIRNCLKELEKNEDFLASYGLTNFAISGHTEGKRFAPWQISDKSRYCL